MRTDPLSFLNAELTRSRSRASIASFAFSKAKPPLMPRSITSRSSTCRRTTTWAWRRIPKLKQAAIDAVAKYGVGSGAVRTISGTMEMHMELERRLAAFKHVESVVVFQSGFAANAGTVSAVLTQG